MMSEKKIRILFGLEAQGHIQTIQNYFDKHTRTIERNGKQIVIDPRFNMSDWKKIGEIIGWCPFTACLHWFKYQDKQGGKS
jgi:hypothetical protein